MSKQTIVRAVLFKIVGGRDVGGQDPPSAIVDFFPDPPCSRDLKHPFKHGELRP